MDSGPEELNVFLPATFGILVLGIASLASLGLAYLLQYRVILVNAPPFAVQALKGFGVFGICLVLVVILSFMVLEAYAR